MISDILKEIIGNTEHNFKYCCPVFPISRHPVLRVNLAVLIIQNYSWFNKINIVRTYNPKMRIIIKKGDIFPEVAAVHLAPEKTKNVFNWEIIFPTELK